MEEKKSIIRYLPLILVNIILISMLLQAYIRDADVHPLFTLMMMTIWFFINLLCIFIMGVSDRKETNVDVDKSHRTPESKTETLFTSIIYKVKYIAIIYVNYHLIFSVVDRYRKNIPTSSLAFITILIYNLFCFYFIMRVRQSKDREFYCFIMIILPVLVSILINIIAQSK